MMVRVDPTGKKTRYVYGVGLDYEVDQTTSQAKYYHYDFTGGTPAMTDQSGTVMDRFFYTPYGQVTHATGTSDSPFKFGGFLGIITDPNGLLSMRARYYSPVLSRFVSMDPAKFKGGLNWYAYASGKPLTLGDPTGFGSEAPGWPPLVSATLPQRVQGSWEEREKQLFKPRRGYPKIITRSSLTVGHEFPTFSPLVTQPLGCQVS